MIRTIQNGLQCDGGHIPTQNGVNIYALCNIGIVISEYLVIFKKRFIRAVRLFFKFKQIGRFKMTYKEQRGLF